MYMVFIMASYEHSDSEDYCIFRLFFLDRFWPVCTRSKIFNCELMGRLLQLQFSLPSACKYFARALRLHPGLSAAQCDCDWFKEIKASQCIFFPHITMIMCAARRFSGADIPLWR